MLTETREGVYVSNSRCLYRLVAVFDPNAGSAGASARSPRGQINRGDGGTQTHRRRSGQKDRGIREDCEDVTGCGGASSAGSDPFAGSTVEGADQLESDPGGHVGGPGRRDSRSTYQRPICPRLADVVLPTGPPVHFDP